MTVSGAILYILIKRHKSLYFIFWLGGTNENVSTNALYNLNNMKMVWRKTYVQYVDLEKKARHSRIQNMIYTTSQTYETTIFESLVSPRSWVSAFIQTRWNRVRQRLNISTSTGRSRNLRRTTLGWKAKRLFASAWVDNLNPNEQNQEIGCCKWTKKGPSAVNWQKRRIWTRAASSSWKRDQIL